ncbi:hypothetical protein GE09DRAFT_971775 [Coniochaeta sp. 2T2.1]|nr:hypothetical protein GE09DRAFT_971775 [Coniochaeta sp. 2T2.1]
MAASKAKQVSKPTPTSKAAPTSKTTAQATPAPKPLSIPGLKATVAPKTKPTSHATPASEAKKDQAKTAPATKLANNKSKQPQQDPKIISMKKHLSLLSPRHIPPPLRMARNRHLRHWTIHRAWQLFRRKQREAHERELMRMYQGMSLACEELRQTNGPGTREEGYLYRVAMEKKGVYGHNGVPVEYGRMQTETPARPEAWNHGWKRSDSAA